MRTPKTAKRPLAPEHVARLNRLAAPSPVGVGVCQAARFIGLPVNTFDRARGGLNLLPGTCLLIETALAKRDQEGKDP